MNKRLTDHIASINKQFSELPVEVRSKYSVDDSMIEERKMRIGKVIVFLDTLPKDGLQEA